MAANKQSIRGHKLLYRKDVATNGEKFEPQYEEITIGTGEIFAGTVLAAD